MAVTPYRVTPARIGNSSGLRLLMRLEPDEQQQAEADEDSLLLALFLDLLRRAARGMSPPLVRHPTGSAQPA